MKIELYSLPNCIHAEAFRLFLKNNNLPFKEIKILNNPTIKVSYLKMIMSHGIQVIEGFNEHALNQLIEPINKYKPKIILN